MLSGPGNCWRPRLQWLRDRKTPYGKWMRASPRVLNCQRLVALQAVSTVPFETAIASSNEGVYAAL